MLPQTPWESFIAGVSMFSNTAWIKLQNEDFNLNDHELNDIRRYVNRWGDRHNLFEYVVKRRAGLNVYPCLPTAFSRREIQSAIIIAEQQLEEMWASGKAYGRLKETDDAKKGSYYSGFFYGNIMLTLEDRNCVIRLAKLDLADQEQCDDENAVDRLILKDKEDWESFKDWILNYPRD
jgi:hypothetical protein